MQRKLRTRGRPRRRSPIDAGRGRNALDRAGHAYWAPRKDAPSGKIMLGVIGVGSQGQGDMRDFLTNEHVRVTAICDVNRRRIDSARQHIAKAYGTSDVTRVYRLPRAQRRTVDRRRADGPARALAQHPRPGCHFARQAHLSRKAHGHVFRGSPAGARRRCARRACSSVRHAAAFRPEIPLGLRAGPQRPAGKAQGDPVSVPGGRPGRPSRSSPCPTTSTGTAGWGRPP